MFLPETTQAQPGVVTPGTQPVTDSDYALADKVVRALLAKPAGKTIDQLAAYILDYIQVNNLLLPISQVVGFSQYAAQVNGVSTSETCSSVTYTNLATTGPQITGLPDGNYLLIFGTTVSVGSTDNVYYSPKVNSTEAVDADALILKTSTVNAGGVWAVTKTINGSGNNTVLMRYRVAAGNTNFANRFLVAFKYSDI